jgi:hypothetical protein
MTDPVQPAGDVPPAATTQPAAMTQPAAVPVTAGVLPLASVIAKPASSGGRGTSLLLLLAGAIAVGGLAFAGGRLTAPAAATTSRTGAGQFQGNGQGFPANGQGFAGRGDGFGGISLSGTVSAVSADSITLELASGTSITIPLDGKTAYHTATVATAGAVTVGSQVRVTPGGGTANPGASLDPNASPGPGTGAISFGAATDVTVVEP